RNSWARVVFFPHFGTLRVRFLFQSREFRAGLGAATQKGEDSTALTGCKGKWAVANVGCYVIRYTTACGIRPFSSTTAGVLGFSLSPRHSSQMATAIPVTSVTNLFTETRRSHQLSGSKSPSFAPEARTAIEEGKTCAKI